MYTGAASNSTFAAALNTATPSSPPRHSRSAVWRSRQDAADRGNGHHAVAISSDAIAAKRTGPHRNGPARRMPYASIRSAALNMCNPSSVT